MSATMGFNERIRLNYHIRVNEIKLSELDAIMQKLARERRIAQNNLRQLNNKKRQMKRRRHADL